MTQRHIGKSGRQMLPLKQRMTPADLQLRAERIRARRTVAEQLAHVQRVWGNILTNFFTRGFWGRLNWLITGR